MLLFYQEWFDEFFFKVSFFDVLVMVEKVGYKILLWNVRMKWIDELKFRGEGEEGLNDVDLFLIYEYDKILKDIGRIVFVFDKVKE